ncbi:hypothetical protein BR63_07070 [Thermanaerosceptrum fracticalcis]|uniref:GPI inositol-deacylase PGAP1-like alpha/beta domain-containing protein n=1 Tax=Thermanaerosceptrum fracticalcis TaxID=1712410 RepID=A0A7G6E1Z0_THEFR|nr:alpha/beta hydrolase [Thermanaerosceptrum fracticalcis]QNB46094.1 hypothetical protein BR63_07070 [Thermanaerosceptrum fracticalcis]
MKKNGLLIIILTFVLFSFTDIIHIKNERYEGHRPILPPESVTSNRNLYFVFLHGIDSWCDGSPFANMGFENIRRAMSVVGYSYHDNRFLLYSYMGGHIENGNWVPYPYTRKNTGQSLYLSVYQLEQLIENITQANPEARFILVGHSLGGRIALDFVSTTHPESRKKIHGVITLNSPLMGSTINVPGILMRILDASGSVWGSTAVKELIYESRFYQDFLQLRTSSIKQLQRDGIQVATFSHYKDYFVRSKTSCLIDAEGDPLTAGFILNNNPTHSKYRFNSHLQILDDQSVISYIVTLASPSP